MPITYTFFSFGSLITEETYTAAAYAEPYISSFVFAKQKYLSQYHHSLRVLLYLICQISSYSSSEIAMRYLLQILVSYL